MQYVPRHAQTTLERLATTNPIVAVTGPRQSGKTTLARRTFPDLPYTNLEDPEVRAIATEDPGRLLRGLGDGGVIDEVQRVPDLFSHLQVHVDRGGSAGPLVMTGSSQFLLGERISQSLAGRVAYVQLLPFSHGELTAARLARPRLEDALYHGGYPPIFDRGADPRQWYGDYIATYVERDVRQVKQIMDLDAFQRFVALCAGSVGQLVNLSRLGSDCGISVNTVKSWLGLLRESYVVLLLLPHHENFRKRIVKAPKLYFVDTGLAARLLGIHTAEQIESHPVRGALFENWVVAELVKGRFARGLRGDLFFWRSHTGQEVDVIAEQGARLVPIECKSGMTTASDWTDVLRWWCELAGDRAGAPHVVYGGDTLRERRGVRMLPWRLIEALASTI